MLIQLRKYLSGYVRVRVEGYSPERLFNLCNANGILIWGVEIHERTYEMFVSVKDYRKMRPFVKKTRTKIILLEKHGLMKCKKTELELIEQEDVVSTRQSAFGVEVLVKDRVACTKKYADKVIEEARLEEIMLFYAVK